MPLFISLALTISVVQNYVVTLAANAASEHLGTKVAVGSIDMGVLGKIKIDDLYVEDLNRDTLLYVNKLDAHLLNFTLADKSLTIGYGEIRGARLNLRQDADSTMNIKKIVDKISSSERSENPLCIHLKDVKISDMELRIEQLKRRNPSYGVDYGAIEILELNATVEDLAIRGPDITSRIERLSLSEKSGFQLNSLAASLKVGSGYIELTDALVESRYSLIHLPRISIRGTSWREYRNFVESVDVDFVMKNSTLSSDDVAYFSPKLQNLGVTLSGLNAEAKGTVDNLDINISSSEFENESALSLKAKVEGLPDIENSHIEAHIKEFTSSSEDLERLVTTLTTKEISPKGHAYISSLEWVKLSGGMEGSFKNFDAHVALDSEVGSLGGQFKFRRDKQRTILDGKFAGDDLQLGRLLSKSEVGRLSLETTMHSNLQDLGQSTSLYGVVKSVEYRGEEYNDITYNSTSRNGVFDLNINSRNRALNLDLAASGVIRRGESSQCEALLRLKSADLVTLGLNRRDSSATVQANMRLRVEGRGIEQMSAGVTIDRASYVLNGRKIPINTITVANQSDASGKFIKLNSELLDFEFDSKSSYKSNIDFLRGSMREYLPSLYVSNQAEQPTPLRVVDLRDLNNNSHINVEIKDFDRLFDSTNRVIQIAEGSKLELTYNPQYRAFDIGVKSQYIEINSLLAIGLDVSSRSQSDSLALQGKIHELLIGTSLFDNFKLRGGAKSSAINLEASYRDTINDTSAKIDLRTRLSRELGRGSVARIELKPSYITRGDERWDVRARRIEMDSTGLDIHRFEIRNDLQSMVVEGLVSRSIRDTLNIKLNNFDLSTLSTFTRSLGYGLSGRSSGDVAISSAIINMRVKANVALDSVMVNSIPTPPLLINAQWDTKLNQARVMLSDRIKGDTLIRGYYIPSKVRYLAKLKIDSLNMGILDPPLKGILVGSTGYANAELTLRGERRVAELTGALDVYNFESTVDYTKVKYRIPRAQLVVENNHLTGRGITLLDTLNNRSALDLELNMEHLSNIAYSLRLTPQNLMVLNTTSRDNDLFYGTMFSSGVVDIKGDKRGVDMNITATTRENSSFFMPLTNKSNITSAQFVTFMEPQKVDTSDFSHRKRLIYERRTSRATSNSSLNINATVHVTPQTDFQLVIDPTVGDILRGRGEGDINLKINPRTNTFEMYGDYTISEGSYLFTLRNIVNKRFTIEPGSSIQWSGEPLDATLDIDAIYKLKTSLQPLMADESTRAVPVDCIINLRDKLTRPEVTFDIELPTADPEQTAVIDNLLNDQETISRQFFYLLLTNSFIPEVSGSDSSIGVSSTTSTGFELLTNQLSNWLSTNSYNVVIRYRPESELTGDEIDFGFSRGLINNRLLLELEGNYSSDAANTAAEDENSNASNFSGEAYITWLIDRSGALKLKGFTQTIDRYDENQGLQETGVGLYYHEEFDDFKDLRRSIKLRFNRNKNRRENDKIDKE
ncbi:MAG: translocation/assembly module TamB domain-containing protein [Rikenellaceae bacterium]